MTQEIAQQDILNLTKNREEIHASAKKKRRKQTGLPWIDDPNSEITGETGLWVAVITQAMVDALSQSKNPELVYLKDEAIRWLTGNHKDFVEVCLLAGLDPSYVRRKAKKAIVNPTAWRAAPGFGKRYMERKIYRQKNKQRRIHNASPAPASQDPEEKSVVIKGPWNPSNISSFKI